MEKESKKIYELLTYERPTVDVVATEEMTLLSGSNRGNSGDTPGTGPALSKRGNMFDDEEGEEPENVFSK
jgi:hypothetical protein